MRRASGGMAYTAGLGPAVARHEGSSPSLPTMKKQKCLCGYVLGDKDNPVVCGLHHQEVVADRDRWKERCLEAEKMSEYWQSMASRG